nr:PITH domain-containing protein At3g04780-like isoform X3 [Physcomitrium patens]|eukprot:XP_024374935.1 PITH domain-containing protein At3g04780-like isoform X3 [Physcomitrella patens]
MATTATPATTAAPVQLPLGQVDLADCIEWQSVECLNENSLHTSVNALKQGYREDNGLYLESDADEQLLLYIPFNQVVKLHSLIIRGPPEEVMRGVLGPRTLKLFANRPNMGFRYVLLAATLRIFLQMTQLLHLWRIWRESPYRSNTSSFRVCEV